MASTKRKRSKKSRPNVDEIMSPRFFKALADPTRVAILRRLAEGQRECTVSQVTEMCSVGISAVSRHLALLRDAGILDCERRGKEVYYSVRGNNVVSILHRLCPETRIPEKLQILACLAENERQPS